VILTAQKEANPYTRGTRNEIASYIGSQKGKLATKAAESLMSAVRTNEEAVRFFPLPRWTTSAQVDSELKKLGGDEAAKKEALKDQGKIRWKGFGWADLRFAFSAAGVEHTVEDLTAKVKSMIKCEAGRVPPSEPPTFVPRTQLLFHLGTLTPGALALRDEAAWSTGEIEDARVKFRSERAHAAAKREHERHDAYAVEQPEQPPTIAAGLKIEVLTQLVHEGGHTFNQWLPATVMELPTEDKKKTSADGKKRTVPKDCYFLAYDDGLSAWTKLTEGNFNCARKGSWRLDLDEPENRASGGGGRGGWGVAWRAMKTLILRRKAIHIRLIPKASSTGTRAMTRGEAGAKLASFFGELSDHQARLSYKFLNPMVKNRFSFFFVPRRPNSTQVPIQNVFLMQFCV
jgi:hypothetical protein